MLSNINWENGAPERIRTSDPQIRSQMLDARRKMTLAEKIRKYKYCQTIKAAMPPFRPSEILATVVAIR